MTSRAARLIFSLASLALALAACRRETPAPAPAPPLSTQPGSMGASGEAPTTLAMLTTMAPVFPPEFDPPLAELSKSFESAGVRVVDRAHVDKLLAEHKLTLANVIQAPVSRGRMLGARYLLYAQAEATASSHTLALLCIDVSSGNVIWEKSFGAAAFANANVLDQWAADSARDVLSAIRQSAARAHLPSATVLSVKNRSRAIRFDFMEDTLRGMLEKGLDARGYRVLRRQNPQLLSRETTLGVSGLVRPDAAVLAESADMVLTATFIESLPDNLPFEKTPLHLTLGLKRRGETTLEKRLAFTLSDLERIPADLRETIPPAGAAVSATTRPDESVARLLEAARLQATLETLDYNATLDAHRRQIDLAQRVIYLDPSAREAYYHLSVSLDALTRRTWPNGEKREGSSDETVAAALAYLRFPRTSKEHTREAFSLVFIHIGLINKDAPEKSLPLMREFVRWQHEVDPGKTPYANQPSYAFDRWWRTNPQKRLEFFLWVDALYENKKHLSMLPFEVASAYDALQKYDKAAEYLYDGLVAHQFSQLELNGATAGISHWITNGHAKELAGHLDARRSAALLARIMTREPAAPAPLSALYGDVFGNVAELYQYRSHADEKRLAKQHIATTQPQKIDLDKPLFHSVIVQKTPAGLWMQAGTDDGPLALYFSEKGEKFQRIATPAALTEMHNIPDQAKGANNILSIVDIGEETLFATPFDGLFVLNRKTGAWRRLTKNEGLPTGRIHRMALSSDGKSAWIADGGFLARYEGGKIFLTKATLPLYPDGMLALDDRLFLLDRQKLLLVDQTRGAKTLASAEKIRSMLPVPAAFEEPPRNYNAGVYSWRRLAAVDGKLYYANELGLTVLSADGKPLAHYRADGFFVWQNLGAWVVGNSPLPSCTLYEVIPDDKDPHLLWLLSKENDYIPPYDFYYGIFPKSSWKADMTMPGTTDAYITAFNTQTKRFSKPLHTSTMYVHAQPFGDYLYMTGPSFRRVPKAAWVCDRAPGADPPTIESPDTPVGRAARALLSGDRPQALTHLQSAIDASIAPDFVRKIHKALSGLPASQATMPASPKESR